MVNRSGKAQNIFISHPFAESDRQWVREFAQSLQRRGANVWLDELQVQAGEPLREALEEGLRNSDMIVAVLSEESVNQPWVFFELGAAVALGKRMVAVVPKDLDPARLPQPLRIRRYLVQESPDRTASALFNEDAGESTTLTSAR